MEVTQYNILELFYHKMEWMQDQVHMESSWLGLNYEYGFQDLVKGVNNKECACLIWREDNYIHQTKHDGLCGQKKGWSSFH